MRNAGVGSELAGGEVDGNARDVQSARLGALKFVVNVQGRSRGMGNAAIQRMHDPTREAGVSDNDNSDWRIRSHNPTDESAPT
jgi:hypothetical protein